MRSFRMAISDTLYLRLYDYSLKTKKTKRAVIRRALTEFLNREFLKERNKEREDDGKD